MAELTETAYAVHMDMLVNCATILTAIPIAELLAQVEREETLAPVLAPTEYQQGGARRLDQQRQLLQAALKLRQVARQLGLDLQEARDG